MPADTREVVVDALDDGFDPSTYADQRVAVVVPDHTRPIDYPEMVEPLVERLVEAGAEPFVFVGMGLHRPMRDEELQPLQDVVDRWQIELHQHDARGEAIETRIEDVADDEPDWPTLPARHPRMLSAVDLVVTVGTVEPHQYAGFSGGAKGLAIGCAGAETIGAMHGLEFLRLPGTRLGAIEGNPFQAVLWRLIESLGPIEALQIVPATASTPIDATFGPVRSAFDTAVSTARERFFEPVDTLYDWLHLPVSAGKGTNLYQASRAATYVALAERPAIAPGGTILVEAPCPEGIGVGFGERACAAAMRRGRDALIDELRSDRDVETEGGQQRAYVLARALERCSIAFVGAPELDELRAMGIEQFEIVSDARDALDLEGRGETITDVFHRVPVERA
jgi:nickel-dependent lactate racemase